MASLKAEVPATAVIRRVNRALEREGLTVRKGRGCVADQLGEYFVASAQNGRVTQYDADLEKIARMHGCLEPWEIVAC